jgi:ABC transport system ATP-binding/permease protein
MAEQKNISYCTDTGLKASENDNPKVAPQFLEHILQKGLTMIGRDPSNTILLTHETISRFHTKIEYRANAFYLTDLNSTNGTFLNGSPVMSSILTPDDTIQIGVFEFTYDGKSLKQASHEHEARVDVIGLRRTVAGGLVILNDISLSINPRELVAIVGGSGAGKSTLMNAIAGFSPADSGVVMVNGKNFYKYFDAFRSTLGYVPQDDIIHRELTVESALNYAACLRMPDDMRPSERDGRISKVLEDLHLAHRKDTAIWQLSGGERKRVSIGVELLTRPRLFFLDEPTSGLDPALEAEMMSIFRKLANMGHTTILITHATKNLKLCDRVVFLARGGHLAYFGPPQEALKYFNAEDFTDIYIKLECEKKPEQWGADFKSSKENEIYVEDRLKEAQEQDEIQRKKEQPPSRIKGGQRRSSVLRQFGILSMRYVEIMIRDSKNLAIVLMQAPLIGILLACVYKSTIFDTATGSYRQAKSLVFFLICICIWFGTSNAAREIAKEIAIYRRERFINLGIAPYILSKMVVLFVLCFFQTFIMLGIILMKVKIPEHSFLMYRNMFLVMLLTSTAATAMGIMISAIVNNPDKAASLVPILLIPQIVFSGAIIPLEGAADTISYLTLSRWGFELLGNLTKISDLPYILTPAVKKSGDLIFDIIPQTHWYILPGYLLLFILTACLFQRLKDFQRMR